jgi:MFS family permease
VRTKTGAEREQQSLNVSTEPNVPALQRRTLLVLILSQISGTIGVGVAPSIGILLAGQVTDSETWAGLARVAATLGTALLGIPLGTLAARRGRRVALSTGWAIATVGGLVLMAAAQWSLAVPMFVGLFLFGAGSAVTMQARFAATDLEAPARKARSLSLVVWMATIGMVLGPNLGVPGEAISRMTGLTDYSSAFLLAVIFSAIAAVVVFVFMRPDPMLVSAQLSPAQQQTDDGQQAGALIGLLHEVRTNRLARIATVAIIVSQVVMTAVMTMTPVHVVHNGGTVTLVGVTISLHIFGMYALSPLAGALTDRHGNRFTMTIGLTVFLISLLIGVFWSKSMTMVVVSLVLLGVGWCFVNVSASALFARAVSSERRASFQGGVDALSYLFGAAAAFASGPLQALTGFSTLNLVAVACLIPLAMVLRRPVEDDVVR